MVEAPVASVPIMITITECWRVCFSNECNDGLPTSIGDGSDVDGSDGDGSDALAVTFSFSLIVFSLIFNYGK